MAFILNQGGANSVSALPSYGYAPEVASRQVRMLLRNNTFMPRLCNSKYKGVLKGKGSKLIIPGEPNVQSKPYIPGQPMVTQVNPRAEDRDFTVERARYMQTSLTKEQEYFSAIGNLAGLYKNSGIADEAQKQEGEFIDFALANAHVSNTGNASGLAGVKSASYLVGTMTKPVLCFDSYAEMKDTASATAPFKAVAAKLLSRTESVLNEQPTNDETSMVQKWMVGPEWFLKQAQLSDITLQSGDLSNTMSYFFRDIGEMKGIGGYNSIFRSNNIQPVVTGAVTAWPVIFGTTAAICYADELTYEEKGVSSTEPGEFSRRVHVYDWYADYTEFLGVAWVTDKDYAVA